MEEKLLIIAEVKEEPNSLFKLSTNERLKAKDFRNFINIQPQLVLRTEYFKCVFYKNLHNSYSRFGAIISKKNVKHAVTRHLYYRILKEAFRLNKILFKNYDVIFILHKINKKISKVEFWYCVQQFLHNLKNRN